MNSNEKENWGVVGFVFLVAVGLFFVGLKVVSGDWLPFR